MRNLRHLQLSERGSTLVEALIVLMVITILLGVAMPVFNQMSESAQDEDARQIVGQGARLADAVWVSEGEEYPANLAQEIADSYSAIDVVAGTSLALNTLSVERISEQIATLRALAPTGDAYALKAIKDGPGRGIYRTHGRDFYEYTNAVTNPSFETGTHGWSTGFGAPRTFETTNSWADSGNTSLQVAKNGASGGETVIARTEPLHVNGGSSYVAHVSAFVRQADLSAGTGLRLRIEWLDDAQQLIGSSIADETADGGEIVLETDGQAPVTAQYARLVVSAVVEASGNVDVMIDAAQLAQSDEPLPYFDGDYPNASWNGVAHAASSRGYAWERWD